MGRRRLAAVLLLLSPCGLLARTPGATEPATRTGWFADEKCATERVANGRTGPPGQACTRECIRKGVRVVFIDEKTGRLYRVENPKPTKGIESDYVEVRGTLDAAAKTVHVDAVHVLEKYAAKCSME